MAVAGAFFDFGLLSSLEEVVSMEQDNSIASSVSKDREGGQA